MTSPKKETADDQSQKKHDDFIRSLSASINGYSLSEASNNASSQSSVKASDNGRESSNSQVSLEEKSYSSMEINTPSPFKKKANQNKKEQLSDLESSSEDEDSDSE